MIEDSEINDLSNVYKGMNIEGKNKMIQAAKKLLDGQLELKDNDTSRVENTELKNDIDIL
jgi:hypothetical protein